LEDIELRVEALEKGDLIFEEQGGLLYIDIMGRVDLDATVAPSDYSADTSFNIRRARFGFLASFEERYHAKIVGALDRGKASVKDVYLDVHFRDYLKLKAGHFRVPLGIERMQDSRDVPFSERSLATINLTAPRDIGIMMYGGIYGDMFNFAIGVFNGDGSSEEGDNDSQKEIVLRSDLKPLMTSGYNLLKNFQIGGGLAIGFGDEGPIHGGSLSTRSGLEFLVTNPAAEYDGWHLRSSLEISHLAGPVGFMYEYISSFQSEVVLGTKAPILSHNYVVGGHTMAIGYNITGEDATFGALKPTKSFSVENGTWGALQVAGRFSLINVDGMYLDTDTDEGFLFTGARRSTEVDLALNWFLNEYMVLKLDYNQTWLSDPVLHKGRELDYERSFTAAFSMVW
jgi:phosphate-selective porin OprO/OprP